MKWSGKELESGLHRATGAIIRCNLGNLLTKSEVQYIRVSGNIALMLPILLQWVFSTSLTECDWLNSNKSVANESEDRQLTIEATTRPGMKFDQIQVVFSQIHVSYLDRMSD